MGTSARAALSALAVRTTYPQAAGHYPHAQCPEAVAELVIPFLKEHGGD